MHTVKDGRLPIVLLNDGGVYITGSRRRPAVNRLLHGVSVPTPSVWSGPIVLQLFDCLSTVQAATTKETSGSWAVEPADRLSIWYDGRDVEGGGYKWQ